MHRSILLLFDYPLTSAELPPPKKKHCVSTLKTTNGVRSREVTKKLGRWCKTEGLMSRVDVNKEIYKNRRGCTS